MIIKLKHMKHLEQKYTVIIIASSGSGNCARTFRVVLMCSATSALEEYWSGYVPHSSGSFPPRVEPGSPALRAVSLLSE